MTNLSFYKNYIQGWIFDSDTGEQANSQTASDYSYLGLGENFL